MTQPDLTELKALAAIVAQRSFRKAADELGLSPSTLSHMMRTLETKMGVRLLHRTTRSVSPTEAGERLINRLRPLLHEMDLALEEVNAFRARPSGLLRINSSEIAARTLLWGVVPAFLARYPDIALDLVTEGRLVDIVAAGFDAGVRLGESVPRDMIAVRIGGEIRFLTVASPGYLARFGVPRSPEDLVFHNAIRIRMPSGKLYRWEYARHGQETTVEVTGSLTLDNMALMADAAAQSLGIAYVLDRVAAPYLADGRLTTVLDEWCISVPGLYLYYPGHRHIPAALRAFIDHLQALHTSTDA